MQIIEIKGKKWMVDLEWEILPGEAAIKQESKDVAEKTNSSFGILVNYQSTYAIGLTKKTAKFPSAGLYLTLANQQFRDANEMLNDYPDWIVIEDVGEERFWMGVVKDGCPAPQFDVILSLTEVKEKITELLGSDTFMIFSTSVEIAAIFDGIKVIENKSLNDLTQDITTKIKFEKLQGIPNSFIYAGIGVLVVTLLGAGVYNFIEGQSLKEKAATLQRQQIEEEQAKQKAYEEELQKYRLAKNQAEENAKQTVLFGLAGNPHEILNSWYYAVGNLPSGTHGWELKSIECYYGVEGQPSKFACDYLYARTGLTTNRMLLDDFPTATIKGNEAVLTQDIAIDPKHLAKPGVETLNNLKNATNWNADMISQLQLLKVVDIDYEIKESQNISYQLPAMPLSPEEQNQGKAPNQEETKDIGIAQGEIVVKGPHFDLVKEIADNVNFNGVGLRKVKFTIKTAGEIEWEAYFAYFINNNTGKIKSSTSSGMSSNAMGNNQAQPMQPQPALPGGMPQPAVAR